MKTSLKLRFLMTLFLMAVVASVGCDQSNEVSELSDLVDATPASDSASIDVAGAKDSGEVGGCCGKCAADQKPVGKADGCCGKCAGEKAAKESVDGCCGKCQQDSSESKEKAQEGCGDCEACAKGDSSACQCEGGSSGEQTSESAGESTDKVKTHAEDRDLFHSLLQNHEQLTRTVKELENGVETVTESSDAAIARKIQEHVASMYRRVEDGRRLRMWDPLYREVFKHADKIKMKLEKTEKGIKVIETSDDPYVVKLIQSHAKVVSGFVKRGFEEAREGHEPPKQ